MLAESDVQAPLETGGVLLGVSDGVNVWIDAVIGPGPAATHRKRSFSPDASYQQQQIAAIYQESGRCVSYLGDWHTHPGSAPYLSWRDRRTLREISRTASARQPNPVMLVFGYGEPWRAVACRYVPAPWYRREQFGPLRIVIQ
jgi:integrative and conjugative element protein (TIGR02256 family)